MNFWGISWWVEERSFSRLFCIFNQMLAECGNFCIVIASQKGTSFRMVVVNSEPSTSAAKCKSGGHYTERSPLLSRGRLQRSRLEPHPALALRHCNSDTFHAISTLSSCVPDLALRSRSSGFLDIPLRVMLSVIRTRRRKERASNLRWNRPTFL